MIDDTSMEFDMFEDMRLKLTEVLVGAGHERIKAERIALYVVQGVREVPKLLGALATRHDTQATAAILEILMNVFDNAPALVKAQNLMLGLDETPLH